MTRAGEPATWLALLSAAWTVGLFAAAWRDRQAALPRHGEWSVFATGAFVAVAWASLGGAALRADRTLALVDQRVPVEAAAPFRLAAVLSGSPGLLLSAALLLCLAMTIIAGNAARSGGELPNPRIAILAAGVTGLLAIGALAVEPFASTGAPAAGIPPALLHPAAALRPFATLGAVVLAGVSLTTIIAARGGNVNALEADASVRANVLGAWLLASAALAADQMARSAITLPEGSPGSAGRNAGGIVLWLLLSIALHHRVRAWLQSMPPHTSRPATRWQAIAVHTGAALVALSFAAHIVAKRSTLSLPAGRPVQVSDVFGRPWKLTNQGVSRFDAAAGNHDVTALAVEVTAPGTTRLLAPEFRDYRAPSGEPLAPPVSVRASYRSALQELLITLDATSEDDVAHVRVSFVPLVALWLPGMLLMLGGGLAALAVPAWSAAVDGGGTA